MVTVTLPREDYRRLQWLLGIVDRMEGWCSINRAIGKYLLIGAIGLLIFLSQGLDAIRNLFSWKH